MLCHKLNVEKRMDKTTENQMRTNRPCNMDSKDQKPSNKGGKNDPVQSCMPSRVKRAPDVHNILETEVLNIKPPKG